MHHAAKLFPGYVLINMEMNEDTWHIVRSCPNITGFIGGTPENPAPITQIEADRIPNRINKTGDAPRPKPCSSLVKKCWLLMVRLRTLKTLSKKWIMISQNYI